MTQQENALLPKNKLLLSGNTLKLIACFFMIVDHVGFYMLPSFKNPAFVWLRYFGRLAFPIFCFMIAEGAYYTKHPKKHFGCIAGLALIMQLVLFFVLKERDFTVFVIFAFSVLLIRLSDFSVFFFKKAAKTGRKLKFDLLGALFALAFCALLGALAFACFRTVKLAAHFDANFGFFGMFAPVLMYWFKKYSSLPEDSFFVKCGMILILAANLVGVWLLVGPDYQWISLFALPLLLLYNGKRGNKKLKYFFYLFYPLHMVVIAGITWLLGL